MKKQKIVVPDHKYQPTQAEKEEPVVAPPGMTFEQAVRAALRPVDVQEVSAKEWRKRRAAAARARPR